MLILVLCKSSRVLIHTQSAHELLVPPVQLHADAALPGHFLAAADSASLAVINQQ